MAETRTVLIVDDEPDIRALLRARLERAGHRIIGETATGATAIEAARGALPDVIVLDWEMPEMTGIEALPVLRSAAPTAQIIVFSSRPGGAAEALDSGANAYFDKSDWAALLTYIAGPGDDQGAELRLLPDVVPFSVLVVDDDPTARRLLRLAVELADGEVVEAANLEEATDCLNASLDAVILDRRLPDGDGLELLPVIRERAPAARVIACSNVDDDLAPAWVAHVPKTNMDGVITVLGLRPAPPAEARFDARVEDLLAHWRSRWQRAGSPVGREVVRLIDSAVGALHPADAALTAEVARAYGSTTPAQVALDQIHDLRNLLVSHVTGTTPTAILATVARVNRLLDQFVVAVVTGQVELLRRAVVTGPLDGTAQPEGLRGGA